MLLLFARPVQRSLVSLAAGPSRRGDFRPRVKVSYDRTAKHKNRGNIKTRVTHLITSRKPYAFCGFPARWCRQANGDAAQCALMEGPASKWSWHASTRATNKTLQARSTNNTITIPITLNRPRHIYTLPGNETGREWIYVRVKLRRSVYPHPGNKTGRVRLYVKYHLPPTPCMCIRKCASHPEGGSPSTASQGRCARSPDENVPRYLSRRM